MSRLIKIFPLLLLFFVFLNFSEPVFAHEQYVLTQSQLSRDLAVKGINVWSSLGSPENLKIAFLVTLGIIVGVVTYFFFQHSFIGIALGKFLEKFESFGHVLLRIALAGSLIYGAFYHSFLGPEIPVTSVFFSGLIIPVMYLSGFALLFGMFSRVAALMGFLVLLGSTLVYGDYMITYFNYFGEFLALIIFGSYFFSIDKKLIGVSDLVKKYKNWELLLIRVTYGLSVIYPAITIKLLHPAVIEEIVYQYRLNQIHWLFPSDPLLISLGGGLAQILVGVMIIVGFETRLASLVTFFLYFLSVIYFKEAVWPHYVLLALALYLVINNGGEFGLDNFFLKLIKKGGKNEH